LTLAVPALSLATTVERPPLWVLSVLLGLGVVALLGRPSMTTVDERLAVPAGMVAVVTVSVAADRIWPVAGPTYYQPTIARVGAVLGLAAAVALAVALRPTGSGMRSGWLGRLLLVRGLGTGVLVRGLGKGLPVRGLGGGVPVRGPGRGALVREVPKGDEPSAPTGEGRSWLWAATLLAVLAGWLGPAVDGVGGPRFGRLAEVLLASCLAAVALGGLARSGRSRQAVVAGDEVERAPSVSAPHVGTGLDSRAGVGSVVLGGVGGPGVQAASWVGGVVPGGQDRPTGAAAADSWAGTGSFVLGCAAGLGAFLGVGATGGLGFVGLGRADDYPLATVALVALAGLLAIVGARRFHIRWLATGAASGVVSAWAVSAYDNDWTVHGWVDFGRTADLVATVALVPLFLCAAVAARSLVRTRPGVAGDRPPGAARLERIATAGALALSLGWIGLATLPYAAAWGPQLAVLLVCLLVVVRSRSARSAPRASDTPEAEPR
jgi:hypothetical protein